MNSFPVRAFAAPLIAGRSVLKIAVLACTLMPAFRAGSQDVPPTLRLSDVYVAVAERNPKAAAARFLASAAEARVSPAATLPDPGYSSGS
jgi:hypothetical protein